MRQSSRLPIVITMVVALLCAGVMRHVAESKRETVSRVPGSQQTRNKGSLSSMNSFALALLLGGLRGPLVMILWTQSEQQKQEKNLEGFDTRIEWIRLLQPEFDTVHIFQSWNKAYNISVQMATKANKYLVILDALKYLHDVDAERPNNVNIIYALGQIYFDKLGQSYEKAFYRKRVRTQTAYQPVPKPTISKASNRPIALEQLVDEKGNLLPSHAKELKPIEKYAPFASGISPLGIAYAYYDRARDLVENGKQQHAQLSEQVVHSRAAVGLKFWAEEEAEFGHTAELTAFGFDPRTEKIKFDLVTAKLAPDSIPVDQNAFKQAVDALQRAARLAADSVTYYNHHNSIYHGGYASTIAQVEAEALYYQADCDYLKLRTTTNEAERKTLIESIRKNYSEAYSKFAKLILRYYMNPAGYAKAFPQGGYDPNNLDQFNLQQLGQLVLMTNRATQEILKDQYPNEDRVEFEVYLDRCSARLDSLK